MNAAHLAAAIGAVKAMDVGQKEKVCDRIHAEQPSLGARCWHCRGSGFRCKRSMFSWIF